MSTIICRHISFVQFDPFDLITRRIKPVDQTLQLLCIARFTFDVGNQPLGRQSGKNALVIDFDDVDIMLVEQPHHFEQRPRPILQRDTKARETARSCEVTQKHIREQARVNITTA